MASILKVDTIQDQSGNNIINENADTITIGASGDTITIPSGATITNSGTATGFGKVLQVVSVTNTTQQTTTSGTYVASTGLTASITPSSTSSKILISVMSNIRSSADAAYTLYRGATNLAGAGDFVQIYAGGADIRQLMTINYLDSPSTTSSTTYTLYFFAGAGTAYINQEGSKQGQIILMEIAG